jgi:FecR protein
MTRQSRLTRRVLGASALLCLSLALGAAIGPAAANKVGVAAAVNPDAFSSLAGAPKSQLNIGKSIFYNERIATTTSGLVQVLLVDGSTFTVGPDSDLVIDKFVYDPNKGTGQIAASFSKGVMRFVGGKISKSDNAVTINTPAGAMAVRGCIILTQVTSSSFAAVLVYGDYLKMKNFVVYEPGNGLFISTNGQRRSEEGDSSRHRRHDGSLEQQQQPKQQRRCLKQDEYRHGVADGRYREPERADPERQHADGRRGLDQGRGTDRTNDT